ncbi:Coenzyme F420 hydrogenase/dehydrogenase, beta subunit C-terminal domain [Candidatus Bathyarchaeota archaeon]|nr:Coenzyme F420 hydrogenase/dehydrogenase, beta subunit C-terminal domain [Candidatus Bathyarchaeota archaeon]
MSSRPKAFGNLMAEVIRPKLCVGCGGCSAVCPLNSIEMAGSTPRLISLCISCGMCYNNCPRTSFDEETLEERAFGATRGESEIGFYKGLYAVRALDERIREHCQDGGAVTALLAHMLSEGCVAVVAGLKPGGIWEPQPRVVSTLEELLEAAGTKYTPSPTLVGVASAVKEYMADRVAVVGTPCQVTALRRIQLGDHSEAKFSKALELIIGLFCMETFDYGRLMEFIKAKGVEPKDVHKFDIKRGRFLAYGDDGETLLRVKLREMEELVRECCHHCTDFTSELADISVGNVGSPDGWSTVIVRSDRGEEALRGAEKEGLIEVKPLDEVEPGLEAVVKLARFKRERAKA